MGACCSKKKPPTDKNKNVNPTRTDYNRINTQQRRSQIRTIPDGVWETLTPLDSPYPPDSNVNLDDIIDHNKIKNDTIHGPADELFPERKVGEYVQV